MSRPDYRPTPPDDYPEPSLDGALPCICGRDPIWEFGGAEVGRFGASRGRLICWRGCVIGDWQPSPEKAIEYWNTAVEEANL